MDFSQLTYIQILYYIFLWFIIFFVILVLLSKSPWGNLRIIFLDFLACNGEELFAGVFETPPVGLRHGGSVYVYIWIWL